METIIKKHFKSLIKDNKNLFISIFADGNQISFAPAKAKYELNSKQKTKALWNKVSVDDSFLILELDNNSTSLYQLAQAKKIEIRKTEEGVSMLDITI